MYVATKMSCLSDSPDSEILLAMLSVLDVASFYIIMFRGGVSAIVNPFLLSLYVLTFSLSSLIAMLGQREVPFYN